MPRKRAKAAPVKLGITISEKMSRYLDALVQGGLHGKTPPEVVANLIGKQIEELISKGGLLTKIDD